MQIIRKASGLRVTDHPLNPPSFLTFAFAELKTITGRSDYIYFCSYIYLYINRNKCIYLLKHTTLKYIDFYYKMEAFKVFSIMDIEKRFPDFSRMNLVNWQKKGYIIRIRRGWYCFNEQKPGSNLNWLAANLIYKPSYISTYSALSYYNLIPEAIYQTTSITTKKTEVFNTPLGTFSYNNVKRELFGFGQVLISMNEAAGSGTENVINPARKILMAEPEKSILDFFYIHYQYNSIKEIEHLRFDENAIATLNIEKLQKYLKRFGSRVLELRIKKLLKIYDLS